MPNNVESLRDSRLCYGRSYRYFIPNGIFPDVVFNSLCEFNIGNRKPPNGNLESHRDLRLVTANPKGKLKSRRDSILVTYTTKQLESRRDSILVTYTTK
jgi:hypothetical protein